MFNELIISNIFFNNNIINKKIFLLLIILSLPYTLFLDGGHNNV